MGLRLHHGVSFHGTISAPTTRLRCPLAGNTSRYAHRKNRSPADGDNRRARRRASPCPKRPLSSVSPSIDQAIDVCAVAGEHSVTVHTYHDPRSEKGLSRRRVLKEDVACFRQVDRSHDHHRLRAADPCAEVEDAYGSAARLARGGSRRPFLMTRPPRRWRTVIMQSYKEQGVIQHVALPHLPRDGRLRYVKIAVRLFFAYPFSTGVGGEWTPLLVFNASDAIDM